MSIRKIDIPLFLCFAFFMYPVILGKISLICYAFIYGTALVYLILNLKYVRRFFCIPRQQACVCAGIGFMLLVSVALPVVLHTYDFSYVNEIMAIFRKCLIVLFLIVLILKREKGKPVLETFFFYFCVLQCAYVLVSIVFLALPELKEFWKLILHESAFTQNLYHNFGYAARFGWMGFSGYRSSIDCSFGIVYANYLYANKKSSVTISTGTYYLFLVLCFLGNMFYARTGIIASGIVMLLGILVYRNIKLKYFIVFVACGAVFVALLVLVGSKVKSINEWLTWAVIPIVKLLTGEKETGNASINVITQRMIFIPGFSTFLHGDGYFTDPVTHSYYMRTDLGFMRQLLFWGIPGMMLAYGTTLLSVFFLKRKELVLKLMLIICIVIFEFKGDMYYEVLPIFLLLGFCEHSSNVVPRTDYYISKLRTVYNLRKESMASRRASLPLQDAWALPLLRLRRKAPKRPSGRKHLKW